METVIAAVAAGAFGVVSALVTSSAQNSKAQATMETKLDMLVAQVEKHNRIVERTFKLEEQVKTLFNDYAELRGVTQELAVTARHASERADAAHNRLDRSGIDK